MSDDNCSRLVKLSYDMGYNFQQCNGQRKFGPPVDWVGNPPEKGTEVFVSRVPRVMYEDELVPLFATAGRIYMLRLMMEFSGNNRGFCFVQFTDKAGASRAIETLNGYEIKPGHKINVCKSSDNCRLFLGQIPREIISKADIKSTLEEIVDGVRDVILYLSSSDKTQNRGFCFVDFDSHRSAAIARRRFVVGGIKLWGRQLRVDWAHPEVEVHENIMSKVKAVYVRNLHLRTSSNQLMTLVTQFVPAEEITRLRKSRDFAFIHFRSRASAELIINALNGYSLEDAVLEVTWARPASIAQKHCDSQAVLEYESFHSFLSPHNWTGPPATIQDHDKIIDPHDGIIQWNAKAVGAFIVSSLKGNPAVKEFCQQFMSFCSSSQVVEMMGHCFGLCNLVICVEYMPRSPCNIFPQYVAQVVAYSKLGVLPLSSSIVGATTCEVARELAAENFLATYIF